MNFYETGGLLVRQWVPAQRRRALEVWNGDGWAPHADVDSVLRHGRLVTTEQALALLHQARDRMETLERFSDDEAHVALHARLRRA